MTVLNTRYGLFKYYMLLFQLCNTPFTFQNIVNRSLLEFLDQFSTAYFNDILVYSNNKEDFKKQILKMLSRLHKRGFLNIYECKFLVTEVKNCGIYAEKDRIKIDHKRVKVILNEKTAKFVKDVLFFLRFLNLYGRFIEQFSEKIYCFL